jgi:diguanylate cyclase (GGDEF)-like protein
MLWPRPSIHDLTAIADALTSATDLETAFDALISELSQALQTRACVLQRMERGWMLVAQSRGGIGLSVSGLDAALNFLTSDESTTLLDLRGSQEGLWTSIPLKAPDGGALVVLLSGDWTALNDVLNPLAVLLSLSLRSVRDREVRQSAERLLLAGYKMGRRASHLGSLDVVCQRVVEQVARSLNADRVALALYRPEEERLAIASTHGYPTAAVKDVRIEPGAWVLGHVYSTGRPVLVSDIRRMQGMLPERRQYRTFSFAAVPLFAGAETLGVLCATDKRDGSTFDRRDAVALRTLAVSATLALMAARSDSEVHRLAYAATVDSLTGLFNRPYLDSRLHEEVERAKRGASSLTVLMVDIDNFKSINDAHGHHVGDAALQVVGSILRSTVRVFDVCARYGGDEFAILMPSSDHPSAATCAERIRQRVFDYRTGGEGSSMLPRLTVSIGVAIIEAGEDPADLIRRADQSLYQAKAAGKNRVCVHPPLPEAGTVPPAARVGDESA